MGYESKLVVEARERRLKRLVEAVNESSRNARNVFLFYLGTAAYVAGMVWATTDEDLLRGSDILLSQLDFTVPVIGTYLVAPAVILLFHYNLGLQLKLLSQKLRAFNDEADIVRNPNLIRDFRILLYPFPITQWASGSLRDEYFATTGEEEPKSAKLFRRLLPVMVVIFVGLLPMVLLLLLQGRFVAYHSEPITTWHQGLLIANVILILYFRGEFSRILGFEEDNAKVSAARAADLRTMRRLMNGATVLVLFISLTQAVVPEGWIERTLLKPVGLPNFLDHIEKWPCESPCRSLNLARKTLVEEEVSGEVIAEYIGQLKSFDFDKGSYSENEQRKLSREAIEDARAALAVGLNLRKRDLRGADFTNARLFGVDFRDADLTGTKFIKTDLSGALFNEKTVAVAANFSEAHLKEADLTGVKFKGAIFNNALLDNAVMANAQLENADFTDATLNGVNMRFARLDGGILIRARLQGADLTGARLRGADLQRASLQGAVFERADLRSAKLFDARLQGADLRFTRLEGANLLSALAPGADFSQASLQGAVLEKADLRGAKLSSANLQGANLSGARLQGADLSRARLEGADLSDARLQGADLTEASLQGADLTRADLQGANLRFARLQGVDLREADLRGADASNSNLDLADLSVARLQGQDAKEWREMWQEIREELEKEIPASRRRDRALELIQVAEKRDTRIEPSSAENALYELQDLDALNGPKIPALALLQFGWPPPEGWDREAYDKVLVPYLVGLACGDAAIAQGITKNRVDTVSGLAAALLAETCPAVAGLPEKIKSRLRKRAEVDHKAAEEKAKKGNTGK